MNSYVKEIVGLSQIPIFLLSRVIFCVKHKHDVQTGYQNFNILAELGTISLRHHHCEKLLQGLEFQCHEMYSPYVCRHFQKITSKNWHIKILKQNVQKSFHFTTRQRLIQVRKEICNDYSLINLHCLKSIKVSKVYFKSYGMIHAIWMIGRNNGTLQATPPLKFSGNV